MNTGDTTGDMILYNGNVPLSGSTYPLTVYNWRALYGDSTKTASNPIYQCTNTPIDFANFPAATIAGAF